MGTNTQELVPRACLRDPWFLSSPTCSMERGSYRITFSCFTGFLRLHRPCRVPTSLRAPRAGRAVPQPPHLPHKAVSGTKAKGSPEQHTANSLTLPPAPAVATAHGKDFQLEGWISPGPPRAALAFPYLSLVPCSSLLALPLAPGICCSWKVLVQGPVGKDQEPNSWVPFPAGHTYASPEDDEACVCRYF